MVPTPVVRGTTFGDDRGWVTKGDRQDHRVVLLGQQAQLLDVLLGDAQLRGLIAARRLDPLGRLANALGRGALDDHDGGGRPHSPPVELPLLGATAGAAAAAHCPERAQVVS